GRAPVDRSHAAWQRRDLLRRVVGGGAGAAAASVRVAQARRRAVDYPAERGREDLRARGDGGRPRRRPRGREGGGLLGDAHRREIRHPGGEAVGEAIEVARHAHGGTRDRQGGPANEVRTPRPWIVAAAGYVALTLVFMWPVATHLATALPHDAGD